VVHSVFVLSFFSFPSNVTLFPILPPRHQRRVLLRCGLSTKRGVDAHPPPPPTLTSPPPPPSERYQHFLNTAPPSTILSNLLPTTFPQETIRFSPRSSRLSLPILSPLNRPPLLFRFALEQKMSHEDLLFLLLTLCISFLMHFRGCLPPFLPVPYYTCR